MPLLSVKIEAFDFTVVTIISRPLQIEPFDLLCCSNQWFPLQLCSMSNGMVAAQKTKPWKNMGLA
jgi:hypothetical protein